MRFILSFLISLFGFFILFGQYTDQINSNRPGASIGAFSVGKNVVQFEGGTELRSYKHKSYNNSKVNANLLFLSVRYGLLSEKIELTYDGVYEFDKIENLLINPSSINKRKGFLNNFLGIKYLIYDPFKKERKINVYSWKANNGFKLRDLIPAISFTFGTNVNFENNNPFPYNNFFGNIYRPLFFQNLGIPPDKEPFFNIKGILATQSHFLGSWVFVTNFIYDRFLSDYPEINYILTLTHTINNYWSVYVENQGLKSDLYRNFLFRSGVAYLYSDDLQIEGTIGASTKTTPSSILANIGVSYRLDFHKNYISGEEKEEKEFKKQEKNLKKIFKKNTKTEKKRNRKVQRN